MPTKKQTKGVIVPTLESLPLGVTVSDILKHGTPEEVRQEIGLIASMLESRSGLNEPYRAWLIGALREIYLGGEANKAFRLNRNKRKGHSPHAVWNTVSLVGNLMQQGMSKADAYDLIARLDRERGIMRPPNSKGGDAGGALLKATERAYKRIFGKDSKTE